MRRPAGAKPCVRAPHQRLPDALRERQSHRTPRSESLYGLVPDGDPLFRHTTEGPDDMGPRALGSDPIGGEHPGERGPMSAALYSSLYSLLRHYSWLDPGG